MQDTNVRGPSGECAVASVEARVRSRINIWNCKRKSNKQLRPLKELLGTLPWYNANIYDNYVPAACINISQAE